MSETMITSEMIDAWSNKYAKEGLIRKHSEEFDELKIKYYIELLEKYDLV